MKIHELPNNTRFEDIQTNLTGLYVSSNGTYASVKYDGMFYSKDKPYSYLPSTQDVEQLKDK